MFRGRLKAQGLTDADIDLKLKERKNIRISYIFFLAPAFIISILIIYNSAWRFFEDRNSFNSPIIIGLFLIVSFIIVILCVALCFIKLYSIITGHTLTDKLDSIIKTQTLKDKSNTDTKIKPKSSVVGIVAIGLGIAGLKMPYFVAVLFVPVAFICAFIALRQGDKSSGIIALVLAALGMFQINKVNDEFNNMQYNFQKELESSLRSLR